MTDPTPVTLDVSYDQPRLNVESNPPHPDAVWVPPADDSGSGSWQLTVTSARDILDLSARHGGNIMVCGHPNNLWVEIWGPWDD